MTRHRIRYYIKPYEQKLNSEIKPCTSFSTLFSEGLETTEMEETTHRSICDTYEENNTNINENLIQKLETNFIEPQHELLNNKSSLTLNSTIPSIEFKQSLNVLKNQDITKIIDQMSYVFKFDKITGELKPNEKQFLEILFCPLENILYTMNANCYLMCVDFPEIICTLPVVINGNGCETRFKVRKY